MKIAILSRPGGCFPNIISMGLSDMLSEMGIENKIFYSGIPFLMRLLPLSQKPRHWSNRFHYRISNKLKYWLGDKSLLKELHHYDILVLSECLPNALWKNYLAIEELKKKTKKKIGSYTDGSINNAPRHREMLLSKDDYGDERFDLNLFVSGVIEQKAQRDTIHKSVIGLNIRHAGLKPSIKKEFIAIVDFAQKGYESHRKLQIKVLENLGIKTIVLEGKYELDEIRNLYRQASVFFLSFPETFGLPIAECLACGAYIFTPDSGWPMAWRLNEEPVPWGPGVLPDCFKVYDGESSLINQLTTLRNNYDGNKTPCEVFEIFIKNYSQLYYGNKEALRNILISQDNE